MCVCVWRSEEHTSELQSHLNLVCRLLLEKKYIAYVNVMSFHLHLLEGHDTLCALQCIYARLCMCRYSTCTATMSLRVHICIFFFNDTATPEISTLSLHDALPILHTHTHTHTHTNTHTHTHTHIQSSFSSEIGRAHVCTPVTRESSITSSACH